MNRNVIGGLNKANVHHLKILLALKETLDHFNIPLTLQNIIGETLLRFRILKDRDLEYNTQDSLMCKILMMDQYFGRQLAEMTPCVRCGHCCKQSHCGFGEWNTKKNQCEFLIPQDDETYLCGRYEYIINQPTSEISPAFGAGCCSSLFNTDRERIMQRRRNCSHGSFGRAS